MTQQHHRPGHALIDWLGFSIPQTYNWPAHSFTPNDITPLLQELFGIDPQGVTVKTRSANWYRHRHMVTTASGVPLLHVYTEPTAEQNRNTTAFAVTGYALSSRPDALHTLDPVELVRKIDAIGGNLTRFDGALDRFDGKPTLALMREASAPDVWRDRTITALCRSSQPCGIWDQSIYYGHLNKGTCIHGYDKGKQTGADFPWFRLEFRTKDRDLLRTVKEEIVAGRSIGELVAGLLARYLRFVNPGTRSKYNRPTCTWWEDLIAEGAAFELKRHRAGKTEETVEGKKAPSKFAVTRYLSEALNLDGHFGDVAEAIRVVYANLQVAQQWNLQEEQ
ncbi:hypothetical protein GMLC_21470 [Geomonas limicola]|uniref:Replication initiation protein-like C-terminal domain-containing protein n=1 Tax=Geomonas limicola TaxID=2740186 RepID=A0A6V8N7N6_9BACT|nr:replication initiation factor domain-containing protein [Geomonas limicola]GFO68568.1 hypothetical protein GMLC_21470 [Geomonas limicola]